MTTDVFVRSVRPLGCAALVIAALLLPGCAAHQTRTADESLTVVDAKAIAQEVEREIAAMVPEELVDRVEQQSTGIFMSCPAPGVYHWAGGTRIYLLPGTDGAEIVASAAEEFASRDGWRASLGQTPLGKPISTIRGPSEDVYVFTQWEEQMLWVSSWSPCFRLPDELWPGDDY